MLGPMIRAGRKTAGLTQRDLGVILEVDFTYISKIENGAIDFPPSDKLLTGLADVLHLDRDDVFHAAGKIPPDIGERLRNDRLFLRYVRSLTTGRFGRLHDAARMAADEWGAESRVGLLPGDLDNDPF